MALAGMRRENEDGRIQGLIGEPPPTGLPCTGSAGLEKLKHKIMLPGASEFTRAEEG